MVDTIHIQQNMERNTSKGIDDFYLASFNGTRGGCGDHEEEDTCEGSQGEALLAALDRSTWHDKPHHKGHAEENGQLQYEVAAEAPEPQDGCFKNKQTNKDFSNWLSDCLIVGLSEPLAVPLSGSQSAGQLD